MPLWSAGERMGRHLNMPSRSFFPSPGHLHRSVSVAWGREERWGRIRRHAISALPAEYFWQYWLIPESQYNTNMGIWEYGGGALEKSWSFLCTCPHPSHNNPRLNCHPPPPRSKISIMLKPEKLFVWLSYLTWSFGTLHLYSLPVVLASLIIKWEKNSHSNEHTLRNWMEFHPFIVLLTTLIFWSQNSWFKCGKTIHCQFLAMCVSSVFQLPCWSKSWNWLQSTLQNWQFTKAVTIFRDNVLRVSAPRSGLSTSFSETRITSKKGSHLRSQPVTHNCVKLGLAILLKQITMGLPLHKPGEEAD